MQLHRLAAVVAVLAVNAFAQEIVNLGVGTQKVLTIPGIQRVALGDDSIADVRTLGGNQLLLIGAGAGTTTLLVWKKDGSRVSYSVQVRPRGMTAGPAPGELALPLRIAEQRVLDLPQIERVAIGDSAIADVKTIGDTQLLVVGLASGKTNLLVWTHDGNRHEYFVSVSPAPAEASPSEPGVTVKVGASAELKLANLARVAIGDADIADIATSAAGLSIKGVAPGSTTLITWMNDGSRKSYLVTVTR